MGPGCGQTTESGGKARFPEVVWVVLVALVALSALALSTTRMTAAHPDFARPWDHHKYIAMAAHELGDFHVAPFCWRILNPRLAAWLPFSETANFIVVSFLALWATAVLTYFILRKLGFSPLLSLTGLLFFLTLGRAVRYNLHDFWLTDPLSFLAVTATIACILANRDGAFALVLAIGVTAKESVIFAAPLYYTLKARRWIDWPLLRRAALFTLPSILVLIGLRVLIEARNENAAYLAGLAPELSACTPQDLGWLIHNVGGARLAAFSSADILRYTIKTFGVSLIVLPFLAIRRSAATFARFSPLIVLTGVALLFVSNTERLLVAAFPPLIAMSLRGLSSAIGKTGADERAAVALPLVLLILMVFKERWYVANHVFEGLLLALFFAYILLTSRRRVHAWAKEAQNARTKNRSGREGGWQDEGR